METKPGLLTVTQELEAVVGNPDKGTRFHMRRGSYVECGRWFQDLHRLTNDLFIPPGGIGMFVPVSRAAINKRLREGRLTAFGFQIVEKQKSCFGTERPGKSRPFIYIPVSECRLWAAELALRTGVEEHIIGDLDGSSSTRNPLRRETRPASCDRGLSELTEETGFLD